MFNKIAVSYLIISALILAPGESLADSQVMDYKVSGSSNRIPTIVVDGEREQYTRIVTRELKFRFRMNGRKPKNGAGFSDSRLWIEDQSLNVDPLAHSWTDFTVPVMDIRTWRDPNVRVSAIRICNDELSYQQGADRRKFLKEGRLIERHSAYRMKGSIKWEIRAKSGGSFTDTYYSTYQAPKKKLTVQIKCNSMPILPTATPLSDEVIAEQLEKKNPKLSLRLEPLNVERVGADICPTALRLYGTIKVGRKYQGSAIFVGPHWLSRRKNVKITSSSGGNRNVTATYPINWASDIDESLSAGQSQRKRKRLTFKFNLVNKQGRLDKSVSKTIVVKCKKPRPGNTDEAADELTIEN